jgi:hypothetical protein
LNAKPRERGFSFVETLIAAAIAAMIILVGARSLSVAVRLDAEARATADRLAEAQSIRARVDAGMAGDEWRDGAPKGWVLTRQPAPVPSPTDRPEYDVVSLHYDNQPQLHFEFWSRHRPVDAP